MQSQLNPKSLMALLWGAFLMTIVVYNVVGYTIAGTAASGDLFGDIMAFPLWAVAAMVAAGSFAIPRGIPGKPDSAFAFFIIRMAFAESPAIFGLVLAITTEDIRHLWYLSAISAVLLFAHHPRRLAE